MTEPLCSTMTCVRFQGPRICLVSRASGPESCGEIPQKPLLVMPTDGPGSVRQDWKRVQSQALPMATITKKELIDRISDKEQLKRVLVKRVIQTFLDEVVEQVGNGNRVEFRDFGVFESKIRAARIAQNPKTLERVSVPSKRTVKFKVGRLMKMKLTDRPAQAASPLGSAAGGSLPPQGKG